MSDGKEETWASLKEAQRRKDFKKALDTEDGRRKREEMQVQIRKTKKEDRLQKRRAAPAFGSGEVATPAVSTSFVDPSAAPAADAPVDPAIQMKLRQLPMLVAALNSDDPDAQEKSAAEFRRLLSIENSPPIQQVVDAGVVPRLVSFLSRNEFPKLQFEAAWALTNIASGTSENTMHVIDNGAIQQFVNLLACQNDEVREQAVWALGNIAGDSPHCRDLVLRANSLQPLLEQMHINTKLGMMRNATWTLSNFCRGKPQPPFHLIHPCLDALAALIFAKDEEVLTDACWALSYVSDGPNEKIQAVLQAGVCKRLVQLLDHPAVTVQVPALRTVGNIVTGDDLQTQVIITCGALQKLLLLLESRRKGIKKEACWTISNITAGSRDQIQAVLDANIMQPLIRLLGSAPFDIRKEAAWALSNATSGGSIEQVKFLVSLGCIPPLCDLLDAADPRIISVALEALENILRIGDQDMRRRNLPQNEHAVAVEQARGVERLEALWSTEDNDIYFRSVRILRLYWDAQDADEDETDPEVNDQGQYAFSAPDDLQGNNIDFTAPPS